MLNLTEAQQELLVQVLTAEQRKLLEIVFDDPTADTQLIRQHAYLRGGVDMIGFILNLDESLKEQARQKLDELQARGENGTGGA